MPLPAAANDADSTAPSSATGEGTARPSRALSHQALSPARRRVLEAVADLAVAPDRGSDCVTLREIAEHVGGHPNTSRQHLAVLVDDGLLEVTMLASARPGRRPQGFRLSRRGRAVIEGQSPSAEYRGIVGAFASYLVQEGDAPRRAREVGRLWAERQRPDARPSLTPTDELVELLDILGFEPARAATQSGGEAVVLRACPLLDLAHEHPEVICELHRGMVDGVMRRLGAAEGVALQPMADPDGCRVVVRP